MKIKDRKAVRDRERDRDREGEKTVETGTK